ncbi:predicted GPI-anchored protein 58 [Schistocerca americana]|uniref:predicted GPI-anchored protein 58 n=1 Tax=Schistocerca americana TaxID=7009 RepID=UPI001F4FE9D2|nr:predicted GPI-anchored protein 58 [Schistocerca americana]
MEPSEAATNTELAKATKDTASLAQWSRQTSTPTTAPTTTPALTYASVAASAAAPQVVGLPSLTDPVASSSASPARLTSRRATIATTEPAASTGASTTPQGSATRNLPLLPVPLPSSQPPVSKKPQKRVLTDSAPATSHKKSTPPPPPPAVTMDTTPPPATPTLAPTLHTFVLSTPDPKFLDARTLTKEIRKFVQLRLRLRGWAGHISPPIDGRGCSQSRPALIAQYLPAEFAAVAISSHCCTNVWLAG